MTCAGCRAALLCLILSMVILANLSCSNSDEPTSGDLVGVAVKSGQTDHSGITVKLYRVVDPDPQLTSVLRQYPALGFALTQSCLFDHRAETELRAVTTNSTGRFVFQDIGNGSYNVVADYSGYGFRYALEINVDGNEARPDTLVLYPIEEPPALIAENATWQTGHHYRILQDVQVAEGATLTIEPGAVIRFAGPSGYTKIDVRGTLSSVGEPDQFVRWIRNNTDFRWNQVNLQTSGTQQNSVAFNLFDGGTIGLLCNGSNMSLHSSLFRNCASTGVSISNVANFQTMNCVFVSCVTGLACTYSDAGTIAYSLFDDDHTGISCTTSSFPDIHDNWFANCVEGIFLQDVIPGAGDSLIIQRNLIELCEIGIHASGSSFGSFRYNIIRESDSVAVHIRPITGGYSQPVIHYNNLTGVGTSGHLLELSLAVNTHDVDATNNWWGTSNVNAIENLIYDGRDEGNPATGIVNYLPIRTAPVPGAGISP